MQQYQQPQYGMPPYEQQPPQGQQQPPYGQQQQPPYGQQQQPPYGQQQQPPYGQQQPPYGQQQPPYGQQQPPYGQQQQPPQGQPQNSGAEPVGVGEMPDSDAPDAPAVQPTAPPITDMEKISGYGEFVNPGVSFVPPPPSYEQAMKVPSTPADTADNFKTVSGISEDEARRCLVEYANTQCCWGTRAASNADIKSIQASNAVHYVLETFLETRSTDWTSEPFVGQHVDGPQNGVPPGPWEIEMPPPSWFSDQILKREVPHTASVRVCYGCQGMRLVPCIRCCGWGRTRCSSCHGKGHTGFGEHERRCTWCHGSGKRRCHTCNGMGRVPCPTCDAAGQVKNFIQLTVQFKTHVKDFILERTTLPDHLIRDVQGTILFEDTQPLVHPVQAFPEPQVNEQSAAIVQEHRGLACSGRVWAQRQRIRSVPVFQCDSEMKGKRVPFFVYGDEWRVHVENYPDTCCWGCSLL